MSACDDNRPAMTKAEVADLRAALKASLTASPCSSHPPLPEKVLADSARGAESRVPHAETPRPFGEEKEVRGNERGPKKLVAGPLACQREIYVILPGVTAGLA